MCTDAQVNVPYTLNGTAREDNCHCYTLTTEEKFQSGSLWNIHKIDLRQSFDFKFSVYLGCSDATGADGIVFVLQPISTSVGSTGEGLGFQGISPSIGIPIDTWKNYNLNDPSFDNISIFKNGDIFHSPPDELVSPVTALANSDNIEDCAFHTFRIIWNAATKTLSAEIDGSERVKTTIDLVTDIFKDDPMVFWGFTGATGGSFNAQRVCTSLSPDFVVAEGLNTCYPTPVNFIDSSTSFGTIDKWFWDFGDGSIDSVPNPVTHGFPAPGEYNVKLTILGNDGCLSDPMVKKVISGSKPVAAFGYKPVAPCKNVPVFISDSSSVAFGTVNKWAWQIGGQQYTVKDPGQIVLEGVNRVELAVETLEGCASDLLIDSLNVRALPCPEFYVPSAFSPNNDGKNDRFEFVASGMASLNGFKVFNRYGQLVYSSNDVRAAWDGKFRGVAQPAGTYVWIISGRDLTGAVHQKKGSVILIR